LSSLLIGIVGYFLQKKASESPEFEKIAASQKINENPLLATLKNHKASCIVVTGVVSLVSVVAYSLTVWLPNLVTQLTPNRLDQSKVSIINTFGILLMSILYPIFGKIADRVGMFRMLLVGALGMLVLLLPLFYTLSEPTYGWFVACQYLLIIPVSIYGSPMGAWMVKTFPTEVRYSAVSIGYNMALAIFGGTVALVATGLYSFFRSPVPVGIYMCLLAIVALVCLFYSQRQFDIRQMTEATKLMQNKIQDDVYAL